MDYMRRCGHINVYRVVGFEMESGFGIGSLRGCVGMSLVQGLS